MRAVMPSLVFLAGPIAGRRYKLADGEYVIGRRSDCQIFVPDMRVSRQHARLWKDDDGWAVEDLGSNNGTFLNGNKIQGATKIRHDDEIMIANNRIRVEARDPTETRFPEGNAVTIVDVGASSIIKSREDHSQSGRLPLVSSGMVSIADQRAIRLIERKLDALTQILHATASSDNAETLLGKLVDALLDLFPQASDVGVLVEDERTGELKVQVQRHRKVMITGHGLPGEKPPFGGDLRVPGTIIQHVVSDRRGVLLGDGGADENDEGIGTRMGAPLIYHGAHYGVVYVESKQAGFRQEDVDLLQAIATQAGLAIHATRVAAQLLRREKLERDLRVARQIQRSLLPANVPQVVGLDFAVHYEPAYQIGGDFYDFIWHDPSHLGLAVGDVAGKAISAALYMARLTSELRSRAAIARTPARLLRRVNQEIHQLGDDGMFATLVYCIYDLESRSLVFTNAGHCVPLLRRGDRVFPLQAERAHTPPLGVTPELEAGEARVQLHSGDMLIMVSDGILEARDTRGNEYGLSRLSRRIRTARGTTEDVIKSILADIDAHAGEQAQGDDMTIVAMAIDQRRAKRKTTTLPGVTPVDSTKTRLETETGSLSEDGPGTKPGPHEPD
ncbi:MAG: SpoIIE family protein phosphatase [Deltaproteobacteria bacterium]|nr:SpoIIE family protein phosphatase [Deltaproteobacteria bacterium]MDQ3296899.1 SpoIIE family protein phosphatase [Myxococcota bacterium]